MNVVQNEKQEAVKASVGEKERGGCQTSWATNNQRSQREIRKQIMMSLVTSGSAL